MVKRSDKTILTEDPTCEVWCTCGLKLFISDDSVYRCPRCGTGYRTEFVVFEYNLGETDKAYADEKPIRTREGM